MIESMADNGPTVVNQTTLRVCSVKQSLCGFYRMFLAVAFGSPSTNFRKRLDDAYHYIRCAKPDPVNGQYGE